MDLKELEAILEPIKIKLYGEDIVKMINEENK